MPHPRKSHTDAQRGDGAYDRSILALRRLNAAGYGRGDPARRLTLMHNPAGAFLAAAQASAEREWKDGLERHHGVTFDRLLALNNMPVGRFLNWLLEKGNLQGYLETLVRAFNSAAVPGFMCRHCFRCTAGAGSSCGGATA